MSLDVIQNLHKQLEEAIQDGEIWTMQLKDTEYELEGSRERVQQQATEILQKASMTAWYTCINELMFALLILNSHWETYNAFPHSFYSVLHYNINGNIIFIFIFF